MVFFPEHPKRDQNLKFTLLSETTSIPTPFICGVPPRVLNEAENSEWDLGETLKIRTVRFGYVIFVRITRFSQLPAIPIG